MNMPRDPEDPTLLDGPPDKGAAWRAFLARHFALMDERDRQYPGPEQEPGHPPQHVGGAMHTVLARLSAGQGVDLGDLDR